MVRDRRALQHHRQLAIAGLDGLADHAMPHRVARRGEANLARVDRARLATGEGRSQRRQRPQEQPLALRRPGWGENRQS
jgi:hypothetical protein